MTRFRAELAELLPAHDGRGMGRTLIDETRSRDPTPSPGLQVGVVVGSVSSGFDELARFKPMDAGSRTDCGGMGWDDDEG